MDAGNVTLALDRDALSPELLRRKLGKRLVETLQDAWGDVVDGAVILQPSVPDPLLARFEEHLTSGPAVGASGTRA